MLGLEGCILQDRILMLELEDCILQDRVCDAWTRRLHPERPDPRCLDMKVASCKFGSVIELFEMEVASCRTKTVLASTLVIQPAERNFTDASFAF